MALQMDIVLYEVLPVRATYVKIDFIEGGKENLRLTLAYYVSRESALKKEKSLQQKYLYFKPNVDTQSTNFLRQGYMHIKTLPEFKEAIDVLEAGQA